MPPTLSYPGVYIQELPSAVHTITGVATSIAAFAGTAPQGSIDEAVLVESWSDYQTEYGGLVAGSYLGYSVNQFFANGGQQAYNRPRRTKQRGDRGFGSCHNAVHHRRTNLVRQQPRTLGR
jgi:phage tail sheath protein FI